MENQPDHCDPVDSSVIASFNDILEKHLSRFNKAGSADMVLPLNVPVISCLFLLVERENDIINSVEAPPVRYTNDTLFNDLADIGLHAENDRIDAIRKLAEADYVEIGMDGRYKARESALTLAESIDNAFTGMPGLSLVAYTIQTIEEVLSGRKDIDYALDQFHQTLLSRIARSPEKKESSDPDEPEISFDSTAGREKSTGEKSDILKQANLRMLSKFRSRTTPEFDEPMVFTQSGYSGKVEVKEIFPRARLKPADVDEDTSLQKNNVSEEVAPQAGFDDQHHEHFLDALSESDQSREHVKTPESNIAARETDHGSNDVEQIEVSHPPQEIDDNENPRKTGASNIKIEPEPVMGQEDGVENLIEQETPPEPIDADSAVTVEPDIISETASDNTPVVINEDSIEKQIEAFEKNLAMSCPLCGSGKILFKTTEKGKAYFVCSNDSCGLITWGKPYHFRCPSCNNPFLIEFADKAGNIGLKCPRSTCAYRQKNLDRPLKNNAPISATGVTDTQKRLRKVVRKRLVRKKS